VAAVAALDVGRRDLQQCADAIIRLHAEWRWPALGGEDLSYRLTNGQAVHWSDWRAGKRGLKQVASAAADGSHASFRGWLDFVFTYAGTRSLWAYAQKIPRAALQPGDFFVSPATSSLGHAVLVLDLARDAQGHSVALLGQGFTPAQSFHVLQRAPGQAWFPLDGEKIETPFWTPFGWADLRRLP
jgi:hypothetical protein